MTAPAQAEPVHVGLARQLAIAIASCTYCGAIPGDYCLEMLPGHVHWTRILRARCQHEPLFTSGLCQDALNYGLAHVTAEEFGPGTDI